MSLDKSIWEEINAKEREEAEETVRKWFSEAREQGWGTSINLYFRPNADAWMRLRKDVCIGDVKTGLVAFEGGLYKRTSGPGDCEETLYYLGHVGDQLVNVRLEE